MVVDGSSKKKNRKNKSNATTGSQEPQQQQQPNQTESQPQQQPEQQRIQSPDIISDKQRTDLLLEASMHQSYNGQDLMKNESDDEKSKKYAEVLTQFICRLFLKFFDNLSKVP